MISIWLISFLTFFSSIAATDQSTFEPENGVPKLTVITVATEPTDGFLRFQRSTQVHSLSLLVLGNGTKWQGGNIKYYSGGGYKVNLFKAALEKFKNEQNSVILFVDSYDVIINGREEQILQRFLDFDANVIFSAESYCWPDATLESQYPDVTVGKKFLNSGSFIGYASVLYELVTSSEIDNLDDDQLFYTKIYLNQIQRTQWKIKLDHKSKLFQNLFGALPDIQLSFDDKHGQAFLQNTLYHTLPLVIHGNGFSKIAINSLGNYLAGSWSSKLGCQVCTENTISLADKKDIDLPSVTIGVFIQHSTPFLAEFFQLIHGLNYPRKRISLFIHNLIDFHDQLVQNFSESHSHEYNGLVILPKQTEEWRTRTFVLLKSVDLKSDYYFSIDSDVRLTNADTLRLLIEQNRNVIAPLVSVPDKLWSNFWGSLSSEGYYARSHDYVDIVKRNRIGLWNVPYFNQVYLINGSFLRNQLIKHDLHQANSNEIDQPTALQPTFSFNPIDTEGPDPELSFCRSLRENGVFMWLTNVHYFGHLVSSESFSTGQLHGELWEIHRNRIDWEARYLHPNFSQLVDGTQSIEQPCPDVFWFPIVTETFCDHLVQEMEHFGQWSAGKNEDPRLNTGYENVPTVDIHMRQIGYEQHWLYFLRQYIRPVQEHLYMGYHSDPPKAIMNFVVRYRPNEQPFLRPHHDSSTYTINIALNKAGVDYEGGGCRFLRYNCSLTNLRKGWSLIHPGRLTHYHEGLPTTNGTRYILVSFVDP